MFESIGRDPDREAGRRRTQALALGSLMLGVGLVVGGLAGLAQRRPPERVTLEGPVVDLWPEDAATPGDDEAPPAPPRPPSPLHEGSDQAPDPTAPKAPVDPTPGPAGGSSGGPGPAGPPSGGGCASPPCAGDGDAPQGEGGGTARLLLHEDVVLKRKRDPTYPNAARQAGFGDVRCLARVKVGADGVPYDVAVEGCPVVFHAATRDAVLDWRWYPPRRGKERVEAQVAVGITYRMR